MQTASELGNFYHRSIHTRKKWERARRRRQWWDAFLNRLAPSRNNIFVVGNGYLGNNLRKGHYGKARGRPPIREFLHFASRRRRVVIIPEWNTSATHSACGGEIKHPWRWRSERNWSETCTRANRQDMQQADGPGQRKHGIVSCKLSFRLSTDRFGKMRGVMGNTYSRTPSSHLARTGDRSPLYAKHSHSGAEGSIRSICLETAERKGIRSSPSRDLTVMCAQVQVSRPVNGISFCPNAACGRSMNRDVNAVCNIMKAFLYTVSTGRRPVHLRPRKKKTRNEGQVSSSFR